MWLRLLPLSLVLAAPAGATNPIAEVLCEPTAQMQQRLVREFGERRHASGLRGREQIMELWTDARGDWTMVVTYASGTSCIVAMGEAWQEHSSTPGKDPA